MYAAKGCADDWHQNALQYKYTLAHRVVLCVELRELSPDEVQWLTIKHTVPKRARAHTHAHTRFHRPHTNGMVRVRVRASYVCACVGWYSVYSLLCLYCHHSTVVQHECDLVVRVCENTQLLQVRPHDRCKVCTNGAFDKHP